MFSVTFAMLSIMQWEYVRTKKENKQTNPLHMLNFRNLRFFFEKSINVLAEIVFEKIKQHWLLVYLFSTSSYSFKIAFLLVSHFGGSVIKWPVNYLQDKYSQLFYVTDCFELVTEDPGARFWSCSHPKLWPILFNELNK